MTFQFYCIWVSVNLVLFLKHICWWSLVVVSLHSFSFLILAFGFFTQLCCYIILCVNHSLLDIILSFLQRFVGVCYAKLSRFSSFLVERIVLLFIDKISSAVGFVVFERKRLFLCWAEMIWKTYLNLVDVLCIKNICHCLKFWSFERVKWVFLH